MLLLDDSELEAALRDLNNCPTFHSMCDYVESCAAWGWVPVGSHGHSPATAHAVAAYASAQEGTRMGGAPAWHGAGDAAAGAVHAPAAAAAAPVGKRVNASNSRSSSQSGLDGSYWQQPVPASSGRSGRQRRAVLAPRNYGH